MGTQIKNWFHIYYSHLWAFWIRRKYEEQFYEQNEPLLRYENWYFLAVFVNHDQHNFPCRQTPYKECNGSCSPYKIYFVMETIALTIKNYYRQTVNMMHGIWPPAFPHIWYIVFLKKFRSLTKLYSRPIWKQILFKKQISVTIFCVRDINKLSFRKDKAG